jgi:hypothetical protein
VAGSCYYQDFGIIGEPCFDVDYTQVFYLTDTGRKWNHTGTGIRDRVWQNVKNTVKRVGVRVGLRVTLGY